MRRIPNYMAFVAALGVATLAQAASTATDRIAETLVTASRLGVTDQRVFVLDNAELGRTAFHVADLLAHLPGLAMSTAGPRGALTQARVRGAEANHLLVLIDGVPANDPAGGSEFEFGGLDPAGVDRIEYLAGPQSAVWGSDALAGVLHIVTRPEANRRRLSVAFGGNDTIDADAAWARVGEQGFAAVSLGHHRTAGTNAALLGDEKDGFDRTALQLGGGRRIGRWELSFSGRSRTGRTEYDPTPAPHFVPADGDRRTDGDFAMLQASARFNAGDAFVPWIRVASVRTARDNFAESAFTDGTVGRKDVATLAGNWRLGRHRANITAEFGRETLRQAGAATAFGNPNQRQRMSTASLAGEFQAALGPFAVSASARADANDAFDDSLAYRLGAAVGTMPRWFASVGRGIKNPTFVERFGYTPDTFVGNPQLEPETGTGLEAGARWAWERGALAVAAFRTVLEREIDGFHFDAAQGAFTARNLECTSRRRGLELSGHVALGRATLDAAYSYVESTAEGEPEPRRPRHLASVGLRGDLSPRLAMGASLRHSGAAWDRDFSTWPATRVRLDGFRLLRLDAEYAATPRSRWQFIVENALDAGYATVYGYRSPGVAAMVRMELYI